MNFVPFSFLEQVDTITPLLPVTDNLVLWYDGGNILSNPGSGSIWYPLSPSSGSLTASLNNGASFTTSNSGAVAFDGTNDYAQATSSVAFDFGTGDFTLEVWVNIVANSTLNNDGNRSATPLACFPVDGAVPTAWGLEINGNNTTTGTGLAFVKYGGGSQNINTSYTFTKGQLYQIGIRGTGGSTSFFINGEPYAASANLSGAVNSGGLPLRIGALGYGGYEQYLNGNIAIIRIYKGKALSDTEILQNYNAAR
jgi:hypothetical protein